ncbi:alpha/beta hydrolase [Leptolyngbya sp. BL0902]|uniref:alpha/beta fold hydrolase n=1 Tax=Leptolyngbya sp. BL0902 TaxID=1115757 RepID=UPI0018E7DFFA|nr:alpha/beta hydrolase [Leptolyngbya sp. BL0902]QQE65427.1 alpha/beta hydrolase [Leptolyngbya sp. BL0902]
MATATLFGVPHNYELTASSDATPLVFVHGWMLSQQYWQPLLPYLTDAHPCLRYDLRGFGQSCHHLDRYQPGLPAAAEALQSSASPYGLAAYARDLAELLRQLQLGPVWLVGHSLGGSIALWAAHCYPDQVKGVTCLNAGGGLYLEREFNQFRQVGQTIVRWRAPWMRHVPPLTWAMMRASVVQPLAYRWGHQRLTDLLDANADAALGSLLESTTEHEVHLLPRLVSTLKQPVYFIAGDQDSVMDLKFVHHLAGYRPGAQTGETTVIPITNCGHMAMLEQPQAVAQAILAQVQNYPAPAESALL